MIKVLEEKQVPRAEIICSNCGSLLEYGNGDLYKREDYSVSVSNYIAYKHYLMCPVCGCGVNATWITRSVR